MTPTVDREQLAALRVLRQAFGAVEVLAVHPNPAGREWGAGQPVQASLLDQDGQAPSGQAEERAGSP